ncbi:sodium:calcium antiporter [Candidatus Woesearchaeota archaeon]|nr:sodium:calcium antiporter [Candidatus Woesearchaeota archaeon]
MVVQDLVLFVLSFVLLILSADWAVKLLSRISAALRFREFFLGFFLVGFGTSLPELLVGVVSAFEGDPVLSLGNVIGSNVVNLTLILGILVILGKGLRVGRKVAKRDMIFMLFVCSLPVFLLLDGSLSRAEGLALFLAFGLYLANSVRESRSFSWNGNGNNAALRRVSANAVLLAVSLAVLLASADFVVRYGVALATDMGISVMLVGLIAVAFGTSLPELVFSVRAAAAKKGGMALGNLVGSAVVNSTVVLGATSAIMPITADYMLFVTSATFMIVAMAMATAFAERKGGFTVTQGIALVVMYFIFVIAESLPKFVH